MEIIQVEPIFLIFRGTHESHPHDILIKLQRLLVVLDSDHAVIEAVGCRICFFYVLRLLYGIEGDDFNPITVRVKSKGNVTHLPIAQLLLEFKTGVFDALARCLNVVYADTNMTKAFARVRIAICDLEALVILGAVIVGQLQDTLTVSPVSSMGHSLGRVIGKEIQVEFRIWILDFVDLLHPKHLIVFDGSFWILYTEHRIYTVVRRGGFML